MCYKKDILGKRSAGSTSINTVFRDIIFWCFYKTNLNQRVGSEMGEIKTIKNINYENISKMIIWQNKYKLYSKGNYYVYYNQSDTNYWELAQSPQDYCHLKCHLQALGARQSMPQDFSTSNQLATHLRVLMINQSPQV